MLLIGIVALSILIVIVVVNNMKTAIDMKTAIIIYVNIVIKKTN